MTKRKTEPTKLEQAKEIIYNDIQLSHVYNLAIEETAYNDTPNSKKTISKVAGFIIDRHNANPETISPEVLRTAITVSTNQLLEAGAIVLGGRFNFSDADQAEWIELTSQLAKARIENLAGIANRANERARENGK